MKEHKGPTLECKKMRVGSPVVSEASQIQISSPSAKFKLVYEEETQLFVHDERIFVENLSSELVNNSTNSHEYHKLELSGFVESPRTLSHEKSSLLCETKLNSGQLEEARRQLYIDNFSVVDSVGKSGCLARIWSADITVQISSYSKHYINFQVQNTRRKFWKGT